MIHLFHLIGIVYLLTKTSILKLKTSVSLQSCLEDDNKVNDGNLQVYIIECTYLSSLSAQLTGAVDPPNKCPGYDTKPSDGEAPVLEL